MASLTFGSMHLKNELDSLGSKVLLRQILMTAAILQCGCLKLDGINDILNLAASSSTELSSCIYLSDPAIQ